jgi:hypothetical protein
VLLLKSAVSPIALFPIPLISLNSAVDTHGVIERTSLMVKEG